MTPTAASSETVVAPLRVMVFRRSVHVHTSIQAMVRVASIPSVVASVDGPSGSDNGVKTHCVVDDCDERDKSETCQTG